MKKYTAVMETHRTNEEEDVPRTFYGGRIVLHRHSPPETFSEVYYLYSHIKDVIEREFGNPNIKSIEVKIVTEQ